ncbi:type II toxin-antitoxin system RatA family toxin [Prosthecomicrobium hirschii]|uniref:type II toxin-antitoxin system RatA family toxin n=1 Tax=Prosthecodimorpha hirschii TaxID=665126 RepID=UPI001129820A|nr:type II toxin-antitoxin system RatA family toxin [Prosthecomicrobium hirschii]MCW1838786.1 type II toxin-antitoxin system RatA family toxin [Prosthecomicrobium hirschii]TPQ50599.1 ubiquinone-binding protein [Prosthecomicrobium hirschii]
MPKFETRHKVRHAAADMFALVADVEAYPKFVPLCEALKVRGRQSRPDGSSVLIADMTVSYKVFRETFTSRVTLIPAENRILVEYLDGPFRQMENRWTFTPLTEKTCEVGFFIAYEFKSRTLGALMGAVFERAFHKFAGAFESRADEVYGV